MSATASAAASATVVPRFLELTTQMTGVAVVPIAFSAQETISAPFQVRVEFLADRGNLRSEDLLYTPACLTLKRSGTPVRYFHGMIRQLTLLSAELRGQWTYAIDVVPRLWFLAQTTDCRVFAQKTVADILDALFTDAGAQSHRYALFGPRQQREYVVQYNETDLTFASRLMQEEGWFYFFEHTQNNHVMVIADRNAAFGKVGDEPMELSPPKYSHLALNSWCPAAATTHGLVCLRDYDPQKPAVTLQAQTDTTQPVAGAATRDLFRWPALTLEPAEVDRRTRLIIEAAEAHAALIDGNGANPAFTAGCYFMMAHDPVTGQDDVKYVLRTVVHSGSEDVSRNRNSVPAYSNTFSCFPWLRPWRDLLTIPRPVAPGILVARVLGHDGEEIHTDALGRVKIRFPWDRREDATADTAPWVRVVQLWAGNAWGTQFIPRVGTEVAVSFIDGDIDRPVVLGGLYNAEQPYPFTLPDRKTVSGLRTRSTVQGGPSQHSELSFDDKIGKELVFLQSQRDLCVNIKASETTTIGGSRTVTIQKDRAVELKEGDDSLKIDKGDLSVDVQMGDIGVDVEMGDLSVDVKMGDISVKADLGSITLEAMQSITLKVGQNSITLSQTGIQISGLMVSSQGQLSNDVKAPMVQLSGNAMMTIKGGIVQIN